MSNKRHLPLLGSKSESGRPVGAVVVEVVLAALASLVLWLPLGMTAMYLASGLRNRLPWGTSPAIGLLAVAPILLSFALASFLAVAITVHSREGRWAVLPPICGGVLAAWLAVALALASGMPFTWQAAALIGLVLSSLAVPSALGGLRLGRRMRR